MRNSFEFKDHNECKLLKEDTLIRAFYNKKSNKDIRLSVILKTGYSKNIFRSQGHCRDN